MIFSIGCWTPLLYGVWPSLTLFNAITIAICFQKNNKNSIKLKSIFIGIKNRAIYTSSTINISIKTVKSKLNHLYINISLSLSFSQYLCRILGTIVWTYRKYNIYVVCFLLLPKHLYLRISNPTGCSYKMINFGDHKVHSNHVCH